MSDVTGDVGGTAGTGASAGAFAGALAGAFAGAFAGAGAVDGVERADGGGAGIDHRRLGVDLYNATWELLDLAERSPDQDDEMVARAHASRYHWAHAPEVAPANAGRSHWLCSRVHAVLGQADTAAYHAARYLDIAQSQPVDDWDLASAHEAAARAAAVGGDFAAAERHEGLARDVLASVADPEDRDVVEADLATLPRRR